ncbi:MAG: aldo/keto reductase [Deltaproteobacteria bacterium]|nr:aldo/keto reductase [Deltaproteobacteria bacterium]
MQYNKLGKSGLRVSELSFGSWLTFGNNLDVKLARQCMQHAFEQGVNFFDNAEAYGAGQSEIVMGEALKDFRREDLVISSKIFWGGQGPNDTGLSRKHLIEGTKNALRRLKLEYVDLLFCHRPDPNTPVEETVLAMDYLVRSGLVFYWGTSEWPAEKIEQAIQLAKELNCIAPTMEQPQYNMLVRDRFEREYAPLFKKYSLGTTVWSPLASGILTGKYNDGIPAGSRLAEQEWLRERLSPDAISTVRKLSEVAKEIDASMTQLALAWCLKNPNVSTVILGATNLKQLDENLGALAVKDRLSDQVLKKIEKILADRAK